MHKMCRLSIGRQLANTRRQRAAGGPAAGVTWQVDGRSTDGQLIGKEAREDELEMSFEALLRGEGFDEEGCRALLDIARFHCFTQGQASPHTRKARAGLGGRGGLLRTAHLI